MYKKITALLLCICIVISFSAVSVSAEGNAVLATDSGGKESFVSSLLKSTKTVCLNKLVTWTMDGFMNSMFEPLAGKGGTSAGTNFNKTGGMRIKTQGEKAMPVDDFWNKFYNSDIYPGAKLLTTQNVNTMLAACAHNYSLADIIKAGNFKFENCSGVEDLLGLVLCKDDANNPFTVDEKHESIWVEYLGMVYTEHRRQVAAYFCKALEDL